ncbi:Ig-like domain repeat protein [Corynebacterium aquatimens]|uniref:Uncharacterized protein n=1 Tax=Corynebacterium aquatimens TaxID=1190508 RepID=A0A931GTE7_9CORY|nr:Ig-like domain repeat protein [Corynebacterium aquatimens]MBG6122937.1 hypothetical protein [Corynebacterium aquatimens]
MLFFVLALLGITQPHLPGVSPTIAQAQTTSVRFVSAPQTININSSGTFRVDISNPQSGKIHFYLDGVPVDNPVNLGNGASDSVTKTITPVSYTNSQYPHVVTARYISADGFNPHPDVQANFQTPLDLTKLVEQGPGRNDGESTYNSKVDGQERNVSNPLAVDPGQQITLDASVAIGGTRVSWTDVYELGINPPAGAEYVSGRRTDNRNTTVLTRGNGTGGVTRLPTNLSDVKWPSWGQTGYPSVTAGYFGVQRTDNYRESRTTPNVQGVYKAPNTPGIYVPQFAQFKYNFNTNHYLRPMETAIFRVKPQELPKRKIKVTLDPNQEFVAGKTTVENSTGSTPAQISARLQEFDSGALNGTVEFYRGSTRIASGRPDASGVVKATLTTAFPAPNDAQPVTVRFIPGNTSLFETTQGSGTVKVSGVDTTVTLTPNQELTVGTPGSLSAKVTGADGAAVTTGSIRFERADGSWIATAGVNAEGVATITNVTFNQIGDAVPVIVKYEPAPGSPYTPKSNAQGTIKVKPVETTVALNPNQELTAGTPGSLSATVTAPGGAVASGSVRFKDQNGAEIGTAQVRNGTATLANTTFEYANPTTPVTVEYVPAPGSNWSASGPTNGSVNVKPVTPTVTVTPNQTFTVNTPGALTATVTDPQGAVVTNGTVTFTRNDGSVIGGPVNVTNGTATLPAAVFSAAGDSIGVTAKYTPASPSKFGPSSGSGNVKVAEAPVVTTTTVTVTAQTPIYAGIPTQLTAKVDGATTGGTIEFFDGGVSLGTANVIGGTATLPEAVFNTVGNDRQVTAVFRPTSGQEVSGSTTVNVLTIPVAVGNLPETGGMGVWLQSLLFTLLILIGLVVIETRRREITKTST